MLILHSSKKLFFDLTDNFDQKFNRKAVIDACGFGEGVLKRSLSYRYFAMNSPAFRPILVPVFMLSSFMYSLSYSDAIMSLSSFNASATNYAYSVDKISASQMSHFIRATDSPITRIFTKIMRFILDRGALYETKSICVKLTSAYEIVMGATDVRLEKRVTPSTNRISLTSLRRGQSQKYRNKVLLFFHGGAFFGPTAFSLENMYALHFHHPDLN